MEKLKSKKPPGRQSQWTEACWGQVCENKQLEKEGYPSTFLRPTPNNRKLSMQSCETMHPVFHCLESTFVIMKSVVLDYYKESKRYSHWYCKNKGVTGKTFKGKKLEQISES